MTTLLFCIFIGEMTCLPGKKTNKTSNACHNSYQKAIIGFVSEQVSYTMTLKKETKPFSNFTKNICIVELLMLMKTLRQNIDQLLHSA